jgi:hypothetical protein
MLKDFRFIRRKLIQYLIKNVGFYYFYTPKVNVAQGVDYHPPEADEVHFRSLK